MYQFTWQFIREDLSVRTVLVASRGAFTSLFSSEVNFACGSNCVRQWV
jgi:hypothetical protein